MAWAQEAYIKYVPRWFRGTPWKKIALQKFEKHGKWHMVHLYIPIAIFYFFDTTAYNFALQRNRPKTEEERMAIKRNYHRDMFQRNWEMGQYQGDVAPYYDLSERRRKYPEHYDGRYDGFRRDGQAVMPKDETAEKKPKYLPDLFFLMH